MDNKLSELSKPVGFIEQSGMDYLRSGEDADIWPDGGRGDDIPLYSQEYVSALLAELEAKAMECRGIEQERELFRIERAAHQQHAQELEKRVAELEAIRADTSLVLKEIGNELGCNPDNESIMMAIDALKEREKRVVALAGGNAELWEAMAARLEAAEARLATPVRLPGFYKDADGNVWLNPVQVVKEIRRSGFIVEGDDA